jgi:hypothetical protein
LARRLWPGPRNHYRGALARGRDDNHRQSGTLATEARTLIRRFHRFEDMVLRFAVDLAVPFTNNIAERAVRPVKVQQRTSGGAWRTLFGLIDFAIVQSYLDTATKWDWTSSPYSGSCSRPALGCPQHSSQVNSYRWPAKTRQIFCFQWVRNDGHAHRMDRLDYR